jgi:hypothetical protein
MPGTPATTPRLALPRYANSDPADFATDGGPPLHASSAIDVAPASGTWLEPSPVCRVTLPLAGDYMVEYGMTGGSNAGQTIIQGVKVGASNPGATSTGQQAQVLGSSSNIRVPTTRRFRLDAAAAATVLAWVFVNDVNLTGNVAAPFLSATPIRVS